MQEIVQVIADVVTVVLLAAGCLMMLVGTIGLLRFPDLPTRLHAVAKADNLGLGLIVAGLVVHVLADADFGPAIKLALVWLLALLATAANSHFLARGDSGVPGEAASSESESSLSNSEPGQGT